MSLASLVKERRLHLRLSQASLAQRAGLSRAYVSKIELGNTADISAVTLVKLARGLELEEQLLLQAAGLAAKPAAEPADRKAAERYLALPAVLTERDIQTLEDLIAFLAHRNTVSR